MTLVHALRRPRLRRAVIAGLASFAMVVVGAAPAAASAVHRAEPWVAVIGAGDAIRIERVEALGPADAAHEVGRETGGARSWPSNPTAGRRPRSSDWIRSGRRNGRSTSLASNQPARRLNRRR